MSDLTLREKIKNANVPSLSSTIGKLLDIAYVLAYSIDDIKKDIEQLKQLHTEQPDNVPEKPEENKHISIEPGQVWDVLLVGWNPKRIITMIQEGEPELYGLVDLRTHSMAYLDGKMWQEKEELEKLLNHLIKIKWVRFPSEEDY